MHKQHEDQPSNELPNLSTWHRVPVGGTIPKNTPYAHDHGGSLTVVLNGYHRDVTAYGGDSIRYYTEHPITPPLPTEEGATIMVSYNNEWPPHVLLTRKAGHWVNRYGTRWNVDQIHAWAPVTIGETVVMP